METQATRNAATVVIRLPPSNTNLSVIVKQPTVYILRVGAPVPRPPHPGDAAHFPVGATLVQRQNIQAAYDVNIKIFLTCQTTENILKSLLKNANEHSYLSVIHCAILGFGVRSPQYIVLHYINHMGALSQKRYR